MTVVVDAALVTAALLDTGRRGRWAEQQLLAGHVVATAALPQQVAALLHRAARDQLITAELATMAHADVSQLPISLFPVTLAAPRAWELLGVLGSASAAAVALAELLECSLATLDPRIGRAKGVRCEVISPD